MFKMFNIKDLSADQLDAMISDCLADLIENFEEDFLLEMAAADDGAYTICEQESDFPVEIIEEALAMIEDDPTFCFHNR